MFLIDLKKSVTFLLLTLQQFLFLSERETEAKKQHDISDSILFPLLTPRLLKTYTNSPFFKKFKKSIKENIKLKKPAYSFIGELNPLQLFLIHF